MEETVRAIRTEIFEIGKLALPVSCTRCLIALTRFTPILLVGRLNSPAALAATSLGFSVASVTGYTMLISFVNGLATLAGQAYGSGNYYTVGYNFQAALLLSTALGIFPISAIWIFSESILLFLGQEESVSVNAGKFLIIMVPSIFTYAYRQCIQIWMQAQGIVRPFTVNAVISFVLSTAITWILVSKYGFIGSAWAQTVITSLMFALDAGYVFFSGAYKKTWKDFSIKKAMPSVKPMLKLAVLSLIMATEWWASEITVLMAGRLYTDDEDTEKNDLMLSAMACFAIINHTCMMLLQGPQLATARTVGNRLGAGNALHANLSAVSGLVLSTLIGLVLGLIIIIGRTPISNFLTTDATLAKLMTHLLFPLAMYQFGMGMCSALEGIVIGSRRQKRAAVFVVIAHYGVGIPVAYICGFTLKLGITGLVMGRIAGKVCQLFLYCGLVIRTNWEEQVQRAGVLVGQVGAAAVKRDSTSLDAPEGKHDIDNDEHNKDITLALLKDSDHDGDTSEEDE